MLSLLGEKYELQEQCNVLLERVALLNALFALNREVRYRRFVFRNMIQS